MLVKSAVALSLLSATIGHVSAESAEASSTGASPSKIQLSQRKIPTHAKAAWHKRRGRRSLSETSVDLKDYFLGTDLQWYGNISVGTPAQTISVVFDTGSSTLEFASTECGSECANQVKFDPSKSSTWDDSGETSSIGFATGTGVTPVNNSVPWTLELLYGHDTVTVGDLTTTDVPLYLITSQTSPFYPDPFSGIQGMGAVAEGFFKRLIDQGLPSLFGMYLTPEADGNAELTVGGIDDSKYTGSLNYVDVPDDSGATWQLENLRIYVNGETTTTLKQQKTIIFDSGTSNVLFDKDTAEAIYAKISSDITAFDDEPGTYGIECSKISGLEAVIDIEFENTDGNAFNLTIPSSELSVGPFSSDPSICQTLINVYEGYEILGGSLLKHYYSVWDVGNQRMGFASNGL